MKYIRLIFLVPISYGCVEMLQLIQLYGYDEFLRNRIILLSGKGYLIQLTYLIIPYVLIEVIYQVHKKSANRYGVMLLCIALSLVPGFLLGSRTNTVITVILILVSIFTIKFNENKIRTYHFMLYSVVFATIAFLVTWLEGFRQQLMGGISDSRTPIDKIANGYGTVENFFWKNDFYNGPPLGWDSIVAAFVSFIPRSLWEDKPFGGGPIWTNIISPGSYNQGSQNISSYTTGWIFEFTLNFGLAGILLAGIVFGIALSAINMLYVRIKNPIDLSIWMMSMYLGLNFLHSEILGGFMKVMIMLLPMAILSVLWQRKGDRKNGKVNYSGTSYKYLG